MPEPSPVPSWAGWRPGGAPLGGAAYLGCHAQRAPSLAREHGEDGEHCTFPAVSTMACSAPVGRSGVPHMPKTGGG